MLAKIYRPAPNAMQSGKAQTRDWVLEFDASAARGIDPLMGWTSSSDTSGQIRMTFETRDEAIAFATSQGVPFQVTEPRLARRIIKSYADNFVTGRRRPWTH
ncbi:MAG: ETC complex I subunit [Alphaproteobacteria bacterium]|nr:ETC complex I subunit [Alphaproteobacteria bacterium]